jgi:hypothetical protein
MAKTNKKTVKKPSNKTASKTPKNNESKTTGKKVPTKERSKATSNNSGTKRSRKETVSKKTPLRKEKSAPKTNPSNKAKVSTKQSNPSGKAAKQGTKSRTKNAGLSIQKPRGENRINIAFKGIKKLKDKIDVFNSDAKKEIKKQLQKKGGKPPRAIVVIVDGTRGRGKKKQPVEAARVSPVDLPINTDTVLDFTSGYLQELQENYLTFIEMQEVISGEEFDPDLFDDENYGDFDPDNVNGISIKFIY